MLIRKLLPVALLAVACSAFAAPARADRLQLTQSSFMEIDEFVPGAKGRPNEESRFAGLKAYKTGHLEQAAEQFQRAASYADKYSQHYLSLMYWYGEGVTQDKVQAYIWSDLAAERGNRRLLAIREKMWTALSAQEQAQAVARGGDFYARYGDEVAKPRAENVMRHFARNMTGSHVGFRGQRLEILGRPVNGVFATQKGSNAAAYAVSEHAEPDELYGKEGGFRRLVDYWQQQDRMLDGNVDVGPVETVRKPKRGDGGLSG
jgi:hypothetical protein